MVNLKEIEWAISELEKEPSSFSNYQKLASLYTIRDQVLGQSAVQREQTYALTAQTAPEQPLDIYGDSEFLQEVSGKDSQTAWDIMDELMETLRVVNPRVYDSVMRKLRRIDRPVF